jgi:hypothetical protein
MVFLPQLALRRIGTHGNTHAEPLGANISYSAAARQLINSRNAIGDRRTGSGPDNLCARSLMVRGSVGRYFHETKPFCEARQRFLEARQLVRRSSLRASRAT